MKRALRDPAVVALAGLVVILVAVMIVNGSSKSSSAKTRRDVERELVMSQRKGCERGKADRSAIAAAFRAQSDYLNLVLAAASVKADVKRAARANQHVQDLSASDLESRTGDNLICAEVIPLP